MNHLTLFLPHPVRLTTNKPPAKMRINQNIKKQDLQESEKEILQNDLLKNNKYICIPQ